MRCAVTTWGEGEAAPRTEETSIARVGEIVADPSTLVWVDVLSPRLDELRALGEQLGLSVLEIEDAIAPRERPKATPHPGRTSFVTYALTPRSDLAEAIESGERQCRAEALHGAEAAGATSRARAGAAEGRDETVQDTSGHDSTVVDGPGLDGPGHDSTVVDRVLEGESGGFGDALFQHTRISGFVHPHALVTVRSNAAFDIEAVRDRWEAVGDVAALGPDGLVHGLLDVIVDQYVEAMQFLDDRIEDLEDDLFAEDERPQGFQRRAYALRKELVSVRRAVLPMRDVLVVLRRSRGSGDPQARERLDALYADLTDHVLRAIEWTDSLRDLVSTVFETHLSLQDQHLNEVTKRLAGWAAVISVPTLVTGWFGMNVPYPGQGTAVGVAVAAVATVVPAAALWALMRRAHWL